MLLPTGSVLLRSVEGCGLLVRAEKEREFASLTRTLSSVSFSLLISRPSGLCQEPGREASERITALTKMDSLFFF